MSDESFELLLNDEEYIERLLSEEIFVVDGAMTYEQARRLHGRLVEKDEE